MAPTGFSAFVTPTATVLDRTGISEQAVRTRDGRACATGDTSYLRFGDWPVIVLAAALVATCSTGGDRLQVQLALNRQDIAADGSHLEQTVTGPSLTSSTAISVRNRPVATVAPRPA